MTDFIEREVAYDALTEYYHHSTDTQHGALREALSRVPAADVRPVVRGTWKKTYADHEAFGVRPFYRYCSECHEATMCPYNYCPNCGADMREVQDAT